MLRREGKRSPQRREGRGTEKKALDRINRIYRN